MRHVIVILLLTLVLYVQVCVGTTLIAARGTDGLILAADSLSPSQNHDASPLISSALSRNIFLLSDEIAIACVKGPSDFHKLYEDLAAVQREEVFQRQRGLSIAAVAKHARQLIHNKYPSAHILIAGCQSISRHGVNNWKLFEVLPGGSLMVQDFVVAGTGGDIATSLLDSLYQQHNDNDANDKDTEVKWVSNEVEVEDCAPSRSCDLTVEDLLPKVQQALTASIKYDPKSGGRNRTIWLLKNNKWLQLVGRKK